MKKNIYIFSGLGADGRMFQKLDFSGYTAIHILWQTPLSYETIEQYTSRLLDQVLTNKPILIGLSFGGMIAIEAAKQINTEKVILISSAKTKNEIPFYYRIFGKLILHKILPSRLMRHSNFIIHWFFGISASVDKALLRKILEDSDPIFMKWAIDKILRWENSIEPNHCEHIHGTSDRIIPYRNVTCNHKIIGGGHFMTVNKSEDIKSKIRDLL
ncbi:MAG: alpha/beta hydrolase [Ignavibacteriae bacterium]|nr:alpha/beta hydrolase [Ignavibacteriota bacterium]